MLNSAAREALETYGKITNPEYAIMVDSPWGSGKTHFIKTIWSEKCKLKNIRYVSLNGVSNEAEFRRALIKDSFKAYHAGKIEIFVNTLSRKIKVGDLGSFARDALEEFFISKLPETLIFDDIERSDINPIIPLGLINDFVEYKEKRVILIVNSKKHQQKEEFLNRKEKLVGRTLKIKADFDAAFSQFIDKLGKKNGGSCLENHKKDIKMVFEQAGHQNLRLLRNALRDCSLVLEQIEDELFSVKGAMTRFIRTYIALAMALMKSEISSDDLDQRDNYKITQYDGIEDDLQGLKNLFKRHKEADIFAYDGAVMSKALCKLLFVDGYAETNILNAQLKLSGRFKLKEENPLWGRVVEWHGFGWDELPDLVLEGFQYLFESNSIEAGPYLLIANSIIHIEKFRGLETPQQHLKDRILERIDELEEQGKIPAAGLGRQFGWEKHRRCFSFDGYSFEADDEFLEIIEAMYAAQLRVYEIQKVGDAQMLLNYFKTDSVRFLGMMSNTQYQATYYRVPIFHKMDIQQFAEASVLLLKNGKVLLLGQLIEKISERHETEENWLEELKWFKSLQEELNDRASKHSRLASAQLEFFFKYHWKFRDPDDVTNSGGD